MSEDKNWSDLQGFKYKLGKELEKVRAMDKAQRKSYFKTYYMIPSIVAFAVLLCLFSYIYEIVQNKRHEPLLCGLFVNTAITSEGDAILKKDFPLSLPEELNPKGRKSIATAEEFLNYTDLEYIMEVNQKLMALVSQVASGDIDFLVVDDSALEGLEKSDIYTEGVEVLDLSENGRSEKLGITPEKAYLVFTYYAWDEEKEQLAKKLIEYIKEL